tara:strand:- start:183 stop:359 length:177 start_codon:yes stop_codon:yes gene_type:complete
MEPVWSIRVTKHNIHWLAKKIFNLCAEYTKTEEVSERYIYEVLKKELDIEGKTSSNKT